MQLSKKIFVGMMLWSAPVMAAGAPTIEGAKMCTKNISRYERQYGIPAHLLSAISATESGRYNEGLKITLPWPWTINAEGQGYYFDSKAEAIAKVRQLQAQGVKSIDVGCMQVNLIHHPNAFANLDDAFDPEHNVAYGASFLRNLYEENQSWKKAAANYHSRTLSRGQEYTSRVYDRWFNIVDRLRAVKADIPETTLAALSNNEMPASPVNLTGAKEATNANVVNVMPTVAPLPEQVGRNVANYRSPRMNTISVAGAERSRENGVLVIRPKITVADDAQGGNAETMTVAQTVPVSQQIAATADAGPTPAASDRIVAKSGPRFIFEN